MHGASFLPGGSSPGCPSALRLSLGSQIICTKIGSVHAPGTKTGTLGDFGGKFGCAVACFVWGKNVRKRPEFRLYGGPGRGVLQALGRAFAWGATRLFGVGENVRKWAEFRLYGGPEKKIGAARLEPEMVRVVPPAPPCAQFLSQTGFGFSRGFVVFRGCWLFRCELFGCWLFRRELFGYWFFRCEVFGLWLFCREGSASRHAWRLAVIRFGKK